MIINKINKRNILHMFISFNNNFKESLLISLLNKMIKINNNNKK